MNEQEFAKQVAKKGFQSADAKYMGLADEPSEGMGKNQKPYRKVKTNWLIEGKEKVNKFTIWTPLKSTKTKYTTESELEQFKLYRIVWKEEEKKYEDKEWVDKTIVIIKDSGDDLKDTVVSVQVVKEESVVDAPAVISHNDAGVAVIAQDVISKIASLEDWDVFEKNYFDLVNPVQQSVNHIFGTYIKTYYPEFFEEVIKKCQALITDNISPK